MKYAVVNEQRQEAKPSLAGTCPSCGQAMVAKCGMINIWHWAHSGRRMCDQWWENETEWHRQWKGQFPHDWQERIHLANGGEKHIADVKTIKDWVIEFQHSHLHPEERKARNNFYEKLVWVVDGTRRKKDKQKFFDSLSEVTQVNNSQSPVRRIFKFLTDECALYRDWSDCPGPVFFDFGKDDQMLWCLLPRMTDGKTYVLEFWRNGFIVFHRNEVKEVDYFADLLKNFTNTILEFNAILKIQSQPQVVLPRQHVRPRRHFRF